MADVGHLLPCQALPRRTCSCPRTGHAVEASLGNGNWQECCFHRRRLKERLALLPALGHNVPPQRVAGELKSGPGRVANADAEVIRAYLAAVGIAVDAARLNLLLTLLGVALLECGAGLAFAIGEGTTSRLADAATSANQVAKDPRVALPIVLPGQLRLTDGDQQDDPQDDTRNDRSVEPHAEPAPAGGRTMTGR